MCPSDSLAPKAHIRTFVACSCLLVWILLGAGGCGTLTPAEDVSGLVESARTPGDHTAIARSLLESADRYAADARRHRELAARYEESGWRLRHRHHDSSDLRMAEHCRRVASSLDRASTELIALAREHESIARDMTSADTGD